MNKTPPDPPEWMGRRPWNKPQGIGTPRRRPDYYYWIYFWSGVLCGFIVYFAADRAFGG